MALRLTPIGGGDEAAAAMELARQALTDAAVAKDKGDEAVRMIRNDRERNAMSLDELRAAAAQLPTTQQAAAEVHLAFQQQIDMLRELINSDATSNDETQAQLDALVQQVATISLTPGPSGKSAYDLARDNGYGGTLTQWLASLRGADGHSVKGDPGLNGKSAYELAQVAGYGGTQAQWLASLKGADGQSIKGDPGTPADMTRVTALETAVALLSAKAITKQEKRGTSTQLVSLGNLIEIPIAWDTPFADANYLVIPLLDSTGGLANVGPPAVKAGTQTKAGVTVTLRANVAVAAGLAVNVVGLKFG